MMMKTMTAMKTRMEVVEGTWSSHQEKHDEDIEATRQTPMMKMMMMMMMKVIRRVREGVVG